MARRALTLGIAALALGAAAAGVASRFPIAQQPVYDLGAIPSAAALRWASAGHPTLVANLWWLRTVQYVGDQAADLRGWDKLYPAVDLVTDLDPGHGYAYQVGANVLSSVERVDESNALLEKGISRVPSRYILYFQRAVNAFLFAGDYGLAARWFERAAAIDGAPAQRMHSYAAAMYSKANAHEAALVLLGHLLQTAQDDTSRKAIRKQLDQVTFERDAAMLEAAAREYRARFGIPPLTLEALVTSGVIAALPLDPFGGTYYLDQYGLVRSTKHVFRYQRAQTGSDREATKKALQDRVHEMEKTIR